MLGKCARDRNVSGSQYLCETLESRRLLALTVPAYDSLLGASRALFLDFDGNPPITDWQNNQGTYQVHGAGANNVPIPGYTNDADANNFSAGELSEIQQIWSWVAEKYSPFNVNVTTVDPGNRNNGQTVQVLMGGSNADWYGSGGGVAAIGGFINGFSNTCFAFAQDQLGFSPARRVQFLGETAAHEAGHEFNLLHQRTPQAGGGVAEYYPGDSTRVPIMGGSSNNVSGARGIWWRTNNFAGQNSPDPVQNDLTTLTSIDGGLIYRSDDFDTNNFGDITFASNGVVNQVVGVIDNTADLDPFRFTPTGSTATFTIANSTTGGMLAPNVNIRQGNTVIPATVTVNNTSAVVTVNSLTPGQTYILQVFSQGQFGDIGQYTINGSVQTFATYDAATQTVNVGGLPGNNNLTLSQGAANFLLVTNNTGSGPASQSFDLTNVTQVRVYLGAGDDTVTIYPFFKTGSNTGLAILANLGGGNNTLATGDLNSFTAFTVNSFRVDYLTANIRSMGMGFSNVDTLQLLGSSSGDTFNIVTDAFDTRIQVLGGSGSDVMNLSPALVQLSGPHTDFFGGTGTDTMNISDLDDVNPVSFNVWDTFVSVVVQGFQREFKYDSGVERITINAGAKADGVQVYALPAADAITLFGNGGDDNFTIGYYDGNTAVPFSAQTLGLVSILGGAGDDELTVQDQGFNGTGNYHLHSTYFRNDAVNNEVDFDGTLEHFGFISKDGGSTMSVTAFTIATAFAIFGGAGGTDSLSVNTIAMQFAPFRADLASAYIDQYFGTPGSFTKAHLAYSGYESVGVNTHNTTTTINIYGTSPDVTGNSQTTLVTGANADTITLFPHDANGAQTIFDSLGIIGGGGVDAFTLDDTAMHTPVNYIFSNPNGASTQDIAGFENNNALVGVLNDIESLTVNAGTGNDSIRVNQYQSSSPLVVNAGAGDDAFVLVGNSMPLIGNWNALFDGAGGNDSLTIDDLDQVVAWTYTSFVGAPATFQRSNGLLGFTLFKHANLESAVFNAGNSNDSLGFTGVPAGLAITFNGNSGDETVSKLASYSPAAVQGPIIFNGGGGTANRIQLLDDPRNTATMVHIAPDTIGAFSNDTYFGAGGFIQFSGVQQITVTGGGGADSFFVAPNINATINLTGGNPTTLPGDNIGFAMAVVTGASFSGTPSSGSLTSSNCKTVTYSQFESLTQDARAPTVTGATFNYNSPQQNITVSFNESLSRWPTGTTAILKNLTTNQNVPATAISAVYAGTTLTLKFPGYFQGVLPNGNYRLTLPAVSAGDGFGNALPADFVFNFFFLNGDSNHSGTVDLSDLVALSANWQGNNKTFAQADFNYDGTVNLSDLVILTNNWQKNNTTFAAPLNAAPMPAFSPVQPSSRQPERKAVRPIDVVI